MPSWVRAEKRRQFERRKAFAAVWYARGVKCFALALVISLALSLGGCSEGGRALLNLSVEKVEYGADSAAEALVKAPCAMTLGAYFRLENPNQRKGAELLCSSRPE